jgi:parallel beta-helix repeat protein
MAYKTIQRALEECEPGDSVVVQSGEYRENIFWENSGSKEGGYITLMGEDGAVISGKGVAEPSLIYLENQSYVRIVNLHFKDTSSLKESYGIQFNGHGSNIEIRKCTFSDLKGKNAMAMAFYGSNPEKPITDVVIDSCTIRNCQPAPSEALVLNGNVDGFKVTKNTIEDINNIGIDFIGGEKDTLKDQTKVARNGICSGNKVSRARSSYGGGYAAGIYVDGGRDIVIEDNIVTGCDMGIEIGAENKGVVVSGITVRNNTFYKNEKAGIAIGGFEKGVGRVRQCLISGNVFYKNTLSKKETQAELWLQHGSENRVLGNSFWVAAGSRMVSADAGGVGNVVDENIWWAEDGEAGVLSHWAGNDTAPGFTNFRKASGQEASGKFTKPAHPDPENGVFVRPEKD